jgi:hypothetical protein
LDKNRVNPAAKFGQNCALIVGAKAEIVVGEKLCFGQTLPKSSLVCASFCPNYFGLKSRNSLGIQIPSCYDLRANKAPERASRKESSHDLPSLQTDISQEYCRMFMRLSVWAAR